MQLNSVLDINTEQWWGFDTAHVGLGDVNLALSNRVATDSSVYFMYYFGGNRESTDLMEYGLSRKVRAVLNVAILRVERETFTCCSNDAPRT